MIINPYAPPPSGPIEKRITLKTRAGEQVSMDVSLADEQGRQSAAEYIHHLYTSIKEKLGEPVLFGGFQRIDPDDREALKRMILFIAAFHDSMFGTFNRHSQLPEAQRNEFVEIFLLACATLLDGKNLLLDLGRGKILNEQSLD
ncbi:MAG: hypothetical protein ACOY5C_04585 [Pseudomonadota bacterium]|uniref:hypothetical protein n=1 Tax=Thermithiobacillus tepidarius TaxID=929 RepID=UPI0003F4C64E|nr:hypothetical protein [Thermithiobacillus tepidarius]